MFGGPAQPDMFGAPAPKAYVPDPRHVRNRLESLLEQLKAAESWPWEPVMVRLHRDRNLPYLCGLLADMEEAERWRAAFAAEMARLEQAA
jgi:hypothetical protein